MNSYFPVSIIPSMPFLGIIILTFLSTSFFFHLSKSNSHLPVSFVAFLIETSVALIAKAHDESCVQSFTDVTSFKQYVAFNYLAYMSHQ